MNSMVRQRNELVSVAEALADLPGPIQAIRKTPPPARRGFTLADQVNQLVSASEADPDLGFMARTMALCSLPRSNPGNRKEYKRVNGPFTLYMVAGGGNKLPYGNLPRLLLAWVCSEAVRTRSRVLILGKSLSEFMRALGIYSSHGRTQTRLRNQMDRLFHASVELNYEDKHGKQFIASRVVDRREFWWNERKPNQPSLWDSEIRLGEDFFNEIISHPIPIDMNTLRHEHPHGPQTLPVGSRSVPVADLPDLRAPRSATALLAAGVPSVRSGTGSRQRQSYRPSLPPQSAPRVEEDQAGLAGVELRDRSGRPDPLALDFDDRSGGCVATAGPIAFTGSSGGETTDFDGKAKNPHHGPNQGRTRGGSLDAVRALRPARAGGHRRSVVQEMSPGRQQKN